MPGNEMEGSRGDSGRKIGVGQKIRQKITRRWVKLYLIRQYRCDGKEKFLPNAIVFSAWNVFPFLNKSGSTNPFLNAFEELNWSFIAALILSFVAFETVPQFVEKPMSFVERVKPAIVFLVINIVYACLIFFLSFVLFVRYDVRFLPDGGLDASAEFGVCHRILV
jgi:hypothetical protein